VSRQDGDYPAILEQLSKYWRAIGVDVRTQLVPAQTIEGNVLIPRAYDVLLYELELGADPDVYAYWHSSQARPNARNLANYKSGIADDVLTSARARSETDLRDAKYRTFVDQWIKDAPAIALYQPTLHYVAREDVRTISPNSSIPDAVGRYRAVEFWTVNRIPAFTTP
jgi:peptide/nickel transport system substrate-binding protein